MSVISARFTQTPLEKKRYLLDYNAELSEGELITLVEATVTSPTNAPVSPAFAVTSIVIAPGSRQAAFYGAGGVDTHAYEVSFLITTSVGQKFEDVVQFDIAEKV